MSQCILALNAGSSSLKFGLYRVRDGEDYPALVATGISLADDAGAVHLSARSAAGDPLIDEQLPGTEPGQVLEQLLGWTERSGRTLAAVGHRIVHGGAGFVDPVLLDDANLAKLEALIPLAPLHQAAGLAPVWRIRSLRPELRQVACFDTAFHRTMTPPASRFALPRELERQGIRRYGFHGLSYESIAAQLAAEDTGRGERIIVAHLGNGASLCAMRELKSVDTTMGFSTLDGLVMGTRPGALDPGVLLYLLKEKAWSADRLAQLLYRESGLLGVSGISADMRTLVASGAPEAREALDLFTFQVARHTAALVATLGGLDRFIFTGGIGEHSAEVRRMIAERLEWLGVELDENANASAATTISAGNSSVLLERRPTEEELTIARQGLATIHSQS